MPNTKELKFPLTVWYLICSSCFNIILYLVTCIISIMFLPVILTFNEKLIAKVLYIWANISLYILQSSCGIKATTIGLENIALYSPFILAVKHQSVWETIFLLKLLGNPVYILKQELAKIPVLGWYIRWSGMIIVDRKSGATAIKPMIKGVKEALESGRSIVIFPEGTRVPYGIKKRLHPGIVAIHHAFPDIPIIPVALNSGYYWGPRAWIKYPGTIKVQFFKPLTGYYTKEELLSHLDEYINRDVTTLPTVNT